MRDLVIVSACELILVPLTTSWTPHFVTISPLAARHELVRQHAGEVQMPEDDVGSRARVPVGTVVQPVVLDDSRLLQSTGSVTGTLRLVVPLLPWAAFMAWFGSVVRFSWFCVMCWTTWF